MIDLNHASGCQYGGAVALPDTTALIAAAIDRALLARNEAQAPRTYVSTSGLGRACLRQIQYDYLAVPKDEGRDFEPRTLRIFEAGHRGEDIVADWLRLAGFDLRTERADGRQFGFSAARRPVQGPHRRLPGRRAGAARLSRALGEQGARRRVLEGRGEARPHARRSRSTPRRSRSTRPTSSCRTRRSSPRSTATPWSSTASSCRSTRASPRP